MMLMNSELWEMYKVNGIIIMMYWVLIKGEAMLIRQNCLKQF